MHNFISHENSPDRRRHSCTPLHFLFDGKSANLGTRFCYAREFVLVRCLHTLGRVRTRNDYTIPDDSYLDNRIPNWSETTPLELKLANAMIRHRRLDPKNNRTPPWHVSSSNGHNSSPKATALCLKDIMFHSKDMPFHEKAQLFIVAFHPPFKSGSWMQINALSNLSSFI